VFEGEGHRSNFNFQSHKRKKVGEVVGATSIEGFLVVSITKTKNNNEFCG